MKSLVSKLGLGHRRKASGDSSAKSTSSSSKEQQPPQQPPQLQPPPPLPPQQQQKTPSSSSRRGTKHHSSSQSSSSSSSSSSGGNKSRKNIINTSDANVPLLSKSLSSSPSSRSSSGGNNNRANQQHHGILHKSHRPPHPNNYNPNMDNDPPHPSRVRFAPQQNSSPHSHNSGYLSSLSSTTSSPSQVHLMACGASVASASVVSKDSIFDRVLREENERLNAMGMGSRDPYDGEEEGKKKEKKDPMRGGRRVEI